MRDELSRPVSPVRGTHPSAPAPGATSLPDDAVDTDRPHPPKPSTAIVPPTSPASDTGAHEQGGP